MPMKQIHYKLSRVIDKLDVILVRMTVLNELVFTIYRVNIARHESC